MQKCLGLCLHLQSENLDFTFSFFVAAYISRNVQVKSWRGKWNQGYYNLYLVFDNILVYKTICRLQFNFFNSEHILDKILMMVQGYFIP